MGRTERPPIDTHTARILNGGIRNLQAKNISVEQGGELNLTNSDITTSGANISFTGGNFTSQSLQVSNSSTFNGPIAVNNDMTISSASIFNSNTLARLNGGIQATGTSTFNGPIVMQSIVNANDPVNFNDTVNMTSNIVNYSNSNQNFIGTNTFTGSALAINNSAVTFGNNTTFNSNVFVTGGVNTNNLFFSGSMTGDRAAFNDLRATDVQFFGVMTGANLVITGSIVSNGVTVGDPSNIGNFAGLTLQNVTGATTSLTIKRPVFNTDSLVYTSASIDQTGTGLTIYDRSGNRTFFLDNETGYINITGTISITGPINIGENNSESNGLGILFGKHITITNCNNPIIIGYANTGTGVSNFLNIYGSSNSITGAFISGINVFGTNNNISNMLGLSLVGNNNNIALTNGTPISKSAIYGSNNTILSPSDETYVIIGHENNFTASTGSIYVLGSGFQDSDILGSGRVPSPMSNILLLGDKTSGASCHMIIAGGLRNLVSTEGNDTGGGIYAYSRIANVKIVTSKTDSVSQPLTGNALYQLIQDSSSRRYKRNIHHTTPDFIKGFMQLKPSSYSRSGNYEYGLIAEEVAEIPAYKPFVGVDSDGKIDSIEYDRMVVLCIAKIQEQQRTINDLNTRLANLEQTISKLFS